MKNILPVIGLLEENEIKTILEISDTFAFMQHIKGVRNDNKNNRN